MEFEWDAAKNRANVAKHGINFEDAIEIFAGQVLEKMAKRVHGEVRFIAFGLAAQRELAVVYTSRGQTKDYFSKEGSPS